MSTDNTNIQEIEFDNLDDLLGVDTESILVPQGEETPEKKPSIFSSTGPDTSFLDKPIKNDEPVLKNEEQGEESNLKKEETPTLEDLNTLLETSIEESEKNPGGRPSLTKDVMIETANKLIEKGLLFPFDDGKKLEDYSQADWEELLEANFNEKEQKLLEEVPTTFYNSLPDELKRAYEYYDNGGRDFKNFFKALSASEEMKSLTVDSEEGQEEIVRSYLHATRYGTPEEIEEEIDALKDRGDLEVKAQRFKPRLDQMQDQIVQEKIRKQQEAREQQQAQAQAYQENVYRALENGEINGVKIDNKIQNLLFSGLVQPNYPSISGRQTNLLGHLLEKYQWVEPRHDLIAEALWLLADPNGYKDKLREGGEKSATAKTVRMLKTEEASKISSSTTDEKEETTSRQPAGRTLNRPKKNFFGR